MHRWPTLVSRKMEKFTFFYFFLFLSSFFLFFSFFCFSSFFFEKKKCYFSELMRRGILSFFFFFESILDRWNCVWNVYLWGLFCPIKGIRECVWWYRWSFFVPFSSSQILRAIHWLEHIVVSARAEKAEETNVFFCPPSLSLHRSFVLNDVLMNYSFVLHTALIINVRSKTIKHEHFYRTELHKNP